LTHPARATITRSIEQDETAESAVASLFGRGSLYMVAFAAQSVVAIAVTPIITRLLGPTEYGNLAAVLAVAQVIQIVAGLGLSAGVQRHYADEEGDAESRGIVVAGLVAGIAITVVLFATLPLWASSLGFSSSGAALRYGVLWAGLYAVSVTVIALIRSQDRLIPFLWVTISQSVGGQALGLVLMLEGHRDAAYYLAGLLIGQGIGLIAGLCWIRPGWDGVRRWRASRHVAAFSLPLVPFMLAGIILNSGDRIVIRRELGLDAVGRYQLAYSAAGALLLVLNLLNQAWEPRIYAVKEDRTRRKVLARSRDTLYYLEIPILLSMSLLSPFLLHLLAPKSFDVASLLTVFSLVAISAVPYTAYLAHMRLLMVERSTLHLAWITPVCAAANIALNVVLIPHFGIAGSAAATLICYGCLAVLVGLIARRKGALTAARPTLWIALICTCAISIGLAQWKSTSDIDLWLRAAGGAVCCVWAISVLANTVSSPDHWLGRRRRAFGWTFSSLVLTADEPKDGSRSVRSGGVAEFSGEPPCSLS
jgi:O-antigen/teichoic acid export membrane protein